MALTRWLLVAALLSARPVFAQPPVPVSTAKSLTSSTCVTAADTGCVVLNVRGNASLAVQVTGTWSGTLTFDASLDGATFQTTNVSLTNGTSAVTTTTANGIWVGAVGGLVYARVRFSSFSSGTAVVSISAAPSGGGSGGGGGSSSVTIQDPNTASQKAAVNASGQLSITCANCSGSGASAVDNSAFTAGSTSGAPAMGFFHSTIDTVTDGDTAAFSMDSKRDQFIVLRDAALNARGANVSAGNALLVDASATTQPVSAASLPLPSGAATAAKQPALGTAGTASTDVITVQGIASMTKLLVTPDSVALPANQSVNVAQINGITPLMGNGTTGTGSPRVTIASDNTAFTVNAAESGTWTVQPGNTANTAPWLAAPATEATTTNSALTCYLTSAATTNSTNCKASAGNVYALRAVNTTSTTYFLRMYNASSAPTCSSATGFVETIPIPNATGTGAGFMATNSVPQGYTTGIGFCITGGGSSTDNTSAATGLYLTILYK